MKKLIIAFVVFSMFTSKGIAGTDLNLQVVASSVVTPVPGVLGAIFSNLNHVDINNAGQVAFLGGYSGGEGIFVGTAPGNLTAVLRDKDPVPGTSPVATFSTFDAHPFLDNQGHVSVVVSNSAVFGDNVWKGFGGTVQQMATRGQAVPGSGGTITLNEVKGFGGPWFNGNGDVAFTSALSAPSGSKVSSGVFTYQHGSLHTVALNGDQAPGLASGVTLNGFTFSLPVINDSGKLAFQTGLSGSNGSAMLTWQNDVLTTEFAKGQNVVGHTGLTWNSFNNPDIGNNGDIAFRASVQGLTGSEIWKEHDGNVDLIAHEGDAVSFMAGATYNSINDPVINDIGNVAFYSSIKGPGLGVFGAQMLFSDGGHSGAHAVFVSGDLANYGLWGDAHFDDSGSLEYVLNANGQVAFLAHLTGSGVNSNNSNALFAEDGHGVLQAVIRTGDLVTLAPGLQRTVSQIIFSSEGLSDNTGNSDGRFTGFNDYGDLAFIVSFKEGGRAVMTAHVVPETGTLALGGITFLVMSTAMIWRKYSRQNIPC